MNSEELIQLSLGLHRLIAEEEQNLHWAVSQQITAIISEVELLKNRKLFAEQV